MILTVQRLSLCPCGAPTLKNIPLGTEYTAHEGNTCPLRLTCQGCGISYLLDCIWCDALPGADAGYVPFDIFDAPLPT